GTQYGYPVNTTALGVGTFILPISAVLANYTLSQVVISVTVLARPTSISSVVLNGAGGTSITLYWNQTLNVNVTYTDTLLLYPISGASVTLNGTWSMTLIGTQYGYPVNTTTLGIGTFILSISASQTNYTLSQTVISITILTRPTALSIALNGTPGNSGSYYYGQNVSVSVTYTDTLLGYFIGGATVTLNGTSNIPQLMTQYATEFNSTTLGIGSSLLTVTAFLSNYTLNQVLISITVLTRNTILSVTLNGQPGTSVQLYGGQNLTVEAVYQDADSSGFIGGATVYLNGTGFNNRTMSQVGSEYMVEFNSTEISAGLTSLTISAMLQNYTGAQQVISISVTVRAAWISEVFLNDTPTNTFSLYWGQIVNVTVWYNDNLTEAFINNSNVQVVGPGVSQALFENTFGPDLLHQYTILLDTTTLGVGFKPLTISAQNVNFTSGLAVISISVLTLPTSISQVYLNGTNGNNTYTLHSGQFLNVTAWYMEQMSQQYLTAASVNLTGPGSFGTVQMLFDATSNAYYYIFDTTALGVGFSTLTIYAIEDNRTASQQVISISVIDRVTSITVLINQVDKTSDPTIEVPIGTNLTITLQYNDTSTSAFIGGAQVNLVGQGLSLSTTISPYYTFVIDTKTLGIGVYFLTASAQLSPFQAQSIKIRVTVRTIAVNVSTEAGSPTINAAPGDTVTLRISIINGDFGGNITNATVTYGWVFGHGSLTYVGNGIYEVSLPNVQVGNFPITITVYAGDDFAYEQYVVTLNVVTPPGTALMNEIIMIVAIAAAVFMTSYLILYQKVLKYPKPVRKMRSIRGNLKKAKVSTIEVEDRRTSLVKEFRKNLGLNESLLPQITGKTLGKPVGSESTGGRQVEENLQPDLAEKPLAPAPAPKVTTPPHAKEVPAVKTPVAPKALAKPANATAIKQPPAAKPLPTVKQLPTIKQLPAVKPLPPAKSTTAPPKGKAPVKQEPPEEPEGGSDEEPTNEE
ncbi:MAG TPA: hypothetical protein VKK79_01760, partial [Candidatus Lokiarchaeia archaeon]|nr:hypothetical protein [Candidatus Lokiarchaeia archaeon]